MIGHPTMEARRIHDDLLELSQEIYGTQCGFSGHVIKNHHVFGQTKIKKLQECQIAYEKIRQLIPKATPRVYTFSIPGYDPCIGLQTPTTAKSKENSGKIALTLDSIFKLGLHFLRSNR